MTRSCLILLALLGPISASAEDRFVTVSCTDDRRVRVYRVVSDGSLREAFTLTVDGKPGAMALSADRSRLYVATVRRSDGRKIHEILTLQRLEKETLRVVGTVAVDQRPTYLRAEPGGRFLLTASYGEGHASVYAIAKGTCGERVARVETEQTAHCIEVDPSGRFAFVPHTAPNVVYQFRFDSTQGSLTANAPPKVDGPNSHREPRHLRFHPTLPMAYTSNEAGGGISAWRFEAKTGTLTLEQTLGTLPPGFEGKSTGAEIRLTPDGRFAYVSNRDHGDAAQDTLAGFQIDAKGKLIDIGHYAVPSFPRSFAIDVDGTFLYVAGQRDGKLAAYRIKHTGALLPVERIAVGAKPSWVLCTTSRK